MKASDTIMSNDDIDGIRFHILDELEKKAKVNWWDICKAVEETRGKQASMDAEQFLIDIANTTGEEVAQSQAEISFRAGYDAAMLEAGRANGLALMEGKRAGIKEAVEFLRNNCYVQNTKETNAWQSKLKEWGVNDSTS